MRMKIKKFELTWFGRQETALHKEYNLWDLVARYRGAGEWQYLTESRLENSIAAGTQANKAYAHAKGSDFYKA